jgi:hypothetical protein
LSVDFFKDECINVLSDKIFGLCDDDKEKEKEKEKPAYIDTNISNKDKNKNGKNEKDDWIATVINRNAHKVTFIAVDNCISLKKENGDKDKRCDVIIIYNNNIIFIELKNCKRMNSKLVNKGIGQLKSTIEHFKKHHDIDEYSKKTAYLSNRPKPFFNSLETGEIGDFKKATGLRLSINKTIKI